MKLTLIALSLIISALSFGQNLADKISKKANYVFTINGGPTLEQVSTNEISASKLFEEMVKEFFRGHEKIRSLDQMGIDYAKRIFFVGEFGEDVSLNYMAYEVKDVTAFETLVKGTSFETKYEEKDGLKMLIYDNENRLIWNDKMAILISAYYVGQEYNEWGWYGNDNYYEEISEASVEIAQPNLEDMTQEEWEAYMAQEDKKREEERKKREEERLKKEQEQEEKRIKRDEIVTKSIENRAKQFFSDELKNKGENLNLNLNDEANATFWYPNYVSFLDPFMYGMAYPRYGYYSPFGYGGLFGMTNLFNGEMVVDLFLEDDEIRMDGKMKYYGEMRDAYSKIFSQKMNSSFTKMISEKDLGYVSMSASSKDFLKEYPTVIENLLGVYDSTYAEEYALFGDLFSIAVDEDALSELMTGDAVFIFHDMGMKSVEYYSYDYDENYNYTKTLKTRMQLVPDFSLVFGSDRKDIMARFVRLGLKYELMEKVDGGYLFVDSGREFGFNVYASVQNEFVIFSNSKSQLKAIAEGNVESPIAGDKKKDVAKNTSAAYFNIKEFVTELLLTDEVRNKDREFLTLLKDDLQDASGTMHFEKDGSVFEVSAPVPANHENASLYLLKTIDKMMNHFDH